MEASMKTNNPTFFGVGFVVLLVLVACGQRPVPVTNPPAVETSLASTALALAKQTEAANPVTVTPSPIPSETPTPTPKISTSGTSLEVTEDQGARFTDHRLGLQLTVPPGWLPIRLNEDEYYQAFGLEAVSGNPEIVDFLSKIQTQDSDFIRLIVLDLRPVEETGGLLTGMSVILQPETIKTMDDWVIANPARANKRIGYLLFSSGYREIPAGIRVLVRDEQWTSTTKGKIFSRMVVFSLPAGILTIGFETDLDSKDTTLPDFEQVIDSVQLLNP